MSYSVCDIGQGWKKAAQASSWVMMGSCDHRIGGKNALSSTKQLWLDLAEIPYIFETAFASPPELMG